MSPWDSIAPSLHLLSCSASREVDGSPVVDCPREGGLTTLELSPDNIGNLCRFEMDTASLARPLDKPQNVFWGDNWTQSKARWC